MLLYHSNSITKKKMANNTVTISGMFGNGKTYFADSPVIIDISGLYWGYPVTSPFTVVKVNVIYNGKVVGFFREDTGGQTTAQFNIQSALQSIWAGYDYADEVAAASVAGVAPLRPYRAYSLEVICEYLANDDDGVYTRTSYGPFDGGRCAIGGFTELERSLIPTKEDADVSYREHENPRFGDASTKPLDSLERVGKNNITSWVDVRAEGTQSYFYPANATPQIDGYDPHAPLVLRDSQDYQDFLFVNRRGALETACALSLEAMDISAESQQYARVERPTFQPSRSIMAIPSQGRRSWAMSSGYQTREWAEWWAMEFLAGRRHWMRYNGRYVPVTIKAAKKSNDIYDRSKQQMAHIDFTVTLALEG